MAEDKDNEQEKFDFTSEGEGYISLAEARVLAVRAAVETPGDYSRNFRRLTMVFEVVESGEDEDFFTVTLSFRPQRNFAGTPGQEQFVVGKEGTIAVRQVLSLPIPTSASPPDTGRSGGGFPVLPVAIVLVVVGAIAAVVVLMGFGEPPPLEPEGGPTETPTPRPTYEPPTPTPTPTYKPSTPRPTNTPSTRRPTDTPSTPTDRVKSAAPKAPPLAEVFVDKWGTKGSGDGQFDSPRDVAVTSFGSVYVADTENNRIQKFESDGVFRYQWGGVDSAAGQFTSPWAVAVAPDGIVYVADASNRIQKFTSNGTLMSKWGTYGTGDGQLATPRGLAVAPTVAYMLQTLATTASKSSPQKACSLVNGVALARATVSSTPRGT